MLEARQALFDNMKRNYEQVVARQDMEPIDIPQLKDETGTPRWHIKEPPGWALSVYNKFNMHDSQVQFACGMIVTHAHDMFGEPIFYDNEINGNEIPLKLRLATLEQSRDTMALTFGDENIVQVFELLVDAKKEIANREIDPEAVKTQSSPETTT